MSAENTPNTPTEDSLPTSETTDVKDNAIDPVTESAAEQNTDLAESDAHDAAYPRLIKTFMKRRTHLNKNAEQALTDPIYAKYIVNTMDDRGQGIIDDITDLRALFADTEQTPNVPNSMTSINTAFFKFCHRTKIWTRGEVTFACCIGQPFKVI
jgi:tRNA (guanine-N7-)-methyltransferase